MLVMMVVALQAGPPAGPPVDIPDRLRAAPKCRTEPNDTGEIVVCGRPDEPYRLKAMPERPVELAIPKAETTLFGNVKGTIEAERGADAQVGPINRAMFRLKMPF